MRSIRGRILSWMVPSLVLVWTIGGVMVYQNTEKAAMASIDSENMVMVRALRMSQGSEGRGRGQGREEWVGQNLPDFEEGVYYQIWDLEGETMMRSCSGDFPDLPMPSGRKSDVMRQVISFAPDLRVRTVEMVFGPGGRKGDGEKGGWGAPSHAGGRPMMITLGRDLAELEKQLERSMMLLVVLGMLVVGGMSSWLWWVLRNGLKPLEKLTRELAQIDSRTLDHRFGGQEEPQELVPILSHLNGLMERLEAGFFRERRFGSDLAHELRTPLAELRMKLELAQRWPDDLDASFLAEMTEIHQRMEATVATLLQLAHLEGKGEFSGERVALLPIVEKGWSPLADRAKGKNLRAELACPDDYEVEGVANLWYHIVGNLLENAVEYTPEGGSLGIRFHDRHLEFWNTAGTLTDDEVAKMFERFWRADDSRQSARHSGLGLSLVKACAEEMGYQIKASLTDHEGEACLVLTVRKD